jgi:hypothetical protein
MKHFLAGATLLLTTTALTSNGHAVAFDLNAGDTVIINATLNTTDPNENGEGEPLVVQANGANIGVVFNYALPASVIYTAPSTGRTDFSYFIRGADGDESATVTATVNSSSPISSPDKVYYAKVAAGYATLSGAFWTYDAVCGAATAGACLLAGTPIAALSSLIAGGFALLAADPIDMNFQSIATPQNVNLPGNLGLVAGMAADEAKAITITSALLTSINRYQGAVAAGDTFWQEQQLAAIRDYQSQLAALIQTIPQDLQDIINQYVASGTPSFPVTASQVLAAEAKLSVSGLPQDVIDLLRQFDLTSIFDISTVTENIFVQDINTLSGVYPDIFPDLLSGASAVPEPISISLLVSGVASLFCVRRRRTASFSLRTTAA